MENSSLLIAAMADQCRALIQGSSAGDRGLPESLRPSHLLWMCDRIEQQVEGWPATRLHRWIGFIQCGMLANRMLDLDGAKAMFTAAKTAYGNSDDDQDLVDHLDPGSAFHMEIGGEA